MINPDPEAGLRLRWAGILCGVITFIWLPVEDRSILFLLLLSLVWSAWLAAWWLVSRQKSSAGLKVVLWAGAGGGMLVFPITILLTLIKAGLHDHGFLDFSSSQLTTIAKTIPLWIALGLVISMLWLKKHPPTLD
ncbi:MAG: hypothetical protein ABFS17_08255 [Chloroflexota bacterium]